MRRKGGVSVAAAALVCSLITARTLLTAINMELSVAEMRSDEAGTSPPSPSGVVVPHPRRLTWFLHFHKAGGSSFAALAGENGVTKRVEGGAGEHGHSHLELTNEVFRWELVDADGLPESCASQKRESLVNRGKAGKGGKGDKGSDKTTSFHQELQREMAGGVTFVSTEHWFPDLSEDKDDDRNNSSNNTTTTTNTYSILRENFNDNVQLVAVFREPIERLVSSYYFHNCDGNRCPIKAGEAPDTRTRQRRGYCNFTEWIRAETNMYTRMLNGVPFGPNKIDRQCSQDLVAGTVPDRDTARLLERAKHVVREKFALVLTLDTLAKRPDVAACALRRVLRWNRTTFPQVNVGRGGGQTARCDRARAPVDGRERAAAARANAPDADLYGVAVATEARMLARVGCA